MTQVNIAKSDDTVVVTVIGHANYSNYGNDIVCAAISMITQTLLHTLHYYEQEKQCKVLTEDTNSGSCVFSYKSYNKEVTEALLNMAKIGYIGLEQSYPDNIKINVS